MGPNGYEFTAGLDTYNGTTAYMGLDTYLACGQELKDLLKLNLEVSHVGGGKLKIYGLWGRATLMNHGNPVTVDVGVSAPA